jgi:hypothetical protein
VRGLEVAARVRVCSTIKPGGIGGRTRVWYRKVGVVCVYPFPYMLAVVCCGILRFGAKPSMVVRL